MKIYFENGRHYFYVDEPVGLDKLLKIAQVRMDMPCGGLGTCGKCKIKVTGDLSPMGNEERRFLTVEEIKNHIRMACFAKVMGKAIVHTSSSEELILSKTTLEPLNLSKKGYGLAIDIGTTTVAMQLYDMATGRVLGQSLRANSQGIYGADVISRIQNAMEIGSEGIQTIIHRQLQEMSDVCKVQAGVDDLDFAVVTGNTVMLHFYEGLDTQNIAVAPFSPTSLFGENAKYSLVLKNTYLPTCLGPYIGADITCSILSSGMIDRKDKIEMLVDLGTNGELVLNYKGILYCASTAAGPAFEGASISYGMRSESGAIYKVSHCEKEVKIDVLGNVEAKGLCGSGILDVAKVMLELGVMDETGRIDIRYRGVSKIDGQVAWNIPNTDVWISQKDIRQIQLAKAAVYAGIKTLLEMVSVSAEEVETIYIAGGLGNYMDQFSAIKIGLLPNEFINRTKLLGNGALSGASMILLDDQYRRKEKIITENSREIVLSGNQIFSKHYVEGMIFLEYE